MTTIQSLLTRLRAWAYARRHPEQITSPDLAPTSPGEVNSSDATARSCKLAGHPYDHDDTDGLGLCACGARWFTPTPKD